MEDLSSIDPDLPADSTALSAAIASCSTLGHMLVFYFSDTEYGQRMFWISNATEIHCTILAPDSPYVDDTINV